MAHRFPEPQAQRLHGRGAHCRVLWRGNRSPLRGESRSYHDPVCSKAEADEAAAEALALGVVAHGAVSVTVRRPDRNWNWELASINPVPSGHGLAQARRAILPLQFAFDLED